jgi:hypothetical protein
MNTGARLPVYKPEANEQQKCSKIAIDGIAPSLLGLFEMKATTLISAMRSRLEHDHKQIELLEAKQAELSNAYNQYLDVQAHIREHERSIEKIGGLVSDCLFGNVENPDTPDEAERQEKIFRWRKNLELWEAVEQYLRFVPDRESRVREILDFLELVEFDCSRQSIEAAIKAHPKVFRVQKRKNEKYISLKGV